MDKQTLLDALQTSCHGGEIADAIGLGLTAIKNHLIKHGLQVPVGFFSLSEQDKKALAQLTGEKVRSTIQSCPSCRDAAKACGCTTYALAYFCRQNRVVAPDEYFRLSSKIGRPVGTPMQEAQKEAYRIRFSGQGNPFHGKKHSVVTRNKMSDSHADFIGDKNPLRKALKRLPGLHASLSKLRSEWWAQQSPEWMQCFSSNMSLIKAQEAMHNTRLHKNYDCGFVETKKGGTVFCRSSWEKWFAGALDESPVVAGFALEPYAIKYTDEQGRVRYSRIDFLVIFMSGRLAVIEVKPMMLQDKYNNGSKIAGYRKHCRESGKQFALLDERHHKNEAAFNELLKRGNEGGL